MATLLPEGNCPMTPNSNEPDPQLNIIELTQLLKAMGFRLNHLGYDENPNPPESRTSSDITVEIKCGNRNIVSRLSAPAAQCSCPEKPENNDHNSSFWEILGTEPSSSLNRNYIADSSSNLLPELSRKGVLITRKLLALIFDAFRKDRKPDLSPDNRKELKVNHVVTSTTIKSPKRFIGVDYELLGEEKSPVHIPVPPNTPGVQDAGTSSQNALNSKIREQSLYMEMKTAKSHMEKALLLMKINMANEFANFNNDPPMDLSKNLVEDQQVPLPITPRLKSGSSSESSSRRASLGAYGNIKSRIDTGAGGAKGKPTLGRHKSTIEPVAVQKAKTTMAATRSNLLVPRKTTTNGSGGGNVKKVSPLTRVPSVKTKAKRAAAPTTAVVGMGSLK